MQTFKEDAYTCSTTPSDGLRYAHDSCTNRRVDGACLIVLFVPLDAHVARERTPPSLVGWWMRRFIVSTALRFEPNPCFFHSCV